VFVDAVRERGLSFYHLESGSEGSDERLEWLSGIEERLVRMGHPASVSTVVNVHDDVRRWRTEMWLGVGSLHEQLLRAARDSYELGDRLVAGMRGLRTGLRAAAAIESDLASAYRTLAAPGASRRFMQEIVAPLREQVGQLSARVSVLRSLR
ncbi:MAG: hypothetical protein ACOC1I_08885, partial [Spirochaetota bacterium]